MGNFDTLPSEIMLEILSRVPTETILECKLVSKPWKNAVQHPCFSQMHMNCLNDVDPAHDSGKLSLIFYTRGINKEAFYYYTEYDESLNRFTRTKRMNLRPPFKRYYMVGSCNGLICFNARVNILHNSYGLAYICNPITREYIILPKFEGKCLLSGFGYVPSTNEYKVVRIYNSKEDPNYGIVQVYTLGSGIGWKNVGKIDYDVMSLQRSVFANGAIHWVDNKGTIVAFDLMDEEFREIPSPPCLPRDDILPILRVLGDFLCAYDHHPGGFNIWVLKKSKGNRDVIWSKEFSNMNARPITFTKNGDLLCQDCGGRKVYRYAPTASYSRMFVNFGKDFSAGVWHKNNLVSLKALGEEDTKLMDLEKEQELAGGQRAVVISQQNRRNRSLDIDINW